MLIYAGIPTLVIAVIVGLVYLGDMRRGGDKRYRPGRPFEFRPVWFLAAPEHHASGAGSFDHKVLSGNAPAALMVGSEASARDEWPGTEAVQQSTTGGASDRW